MALRNCMNKIFHGTLIGISNIYTFCKVTDAEIINYSFSDFSSCIFCLIQSVFQYITQ